MFRLNALCLLTFYVCSAREPPTVTIPKQGTIQGLEISTIRTKRILAYLGIPYARPPVGQLRFAPPNTDPMPSWEGVRNATTHQNPCLQTEKDFKQQDVPFLNLLSTLDFSVDEDCLYLNVYIPYGIPPSEGYPTIVWFHPGNFTTGNPAVWDPYTLVYRQRVIMVTFAWRLNVMGFLTTMDGEAPGNFGLMDQQAALTWVKNNIKIFDGNPDNICLMGYGTGATSIGLHLINPQSKNLFNKVISMSGNVFNPLMVKYPSEDKSVLDAISENFGCFRTPISAFMECLRRVDGTSLVSFTSNIDWRPVIDLGLSNSTPPFLTEAPRNFFERNEFHKVPILTGYTDMEDVLALEHLNLNDNLTNDNIRGLFNEILGRDLPSSNGTDVCVYNYEHIMESVMFFYGPSIPLKDADRIRKLITDFNTEKYYGSSAFLLANYVSKHKSTFVYRFDMKPSTIGVMANVPEWVSVPHLFDLIYVWGIPYFIKLPDQEWDIRDKRTSDIIMSFWMNFAKYSNPTESSAYPIAWEPFTKESPGVLIIDRNFNMSDQIKLNYKAFEFWNEYYPKVIELSTQCCNATWSASDKFNPNCSLLIVNIITIIIVYLTQISILN